MADEMVRMRKIQRGREAQSLLDNPAFKDAMTALKEKNVADYFNTGLEDDSKRQAIWALGNALEAVERQLQVFVQDGKVEESNKLEDEVKRQEN